MADPGGGGVMDVLKSRIVIYHDEAEFREKILSFFQASFVLSTGQVGEESDDENQSEQTLHRKRTLICGNFIKISVSFSCNGSLLIVMSVIFLAHFSSNYESKSVFQRYVPLQFRKKRTDLSH